MKSTISSVLTASKRATETIWFLDGLTSEIAVFSSFAKYKTGFPFLFALPAGVDSGFGTPISVSLYGTCTCPSRLNPFLALKSGSPRAILETVLQRSSLNVIGHSGSNEVGGGG